MLNKVLSRRKYINGAEKMHTSIYLIPRHRAHLELLMQSHGKSMNACIAELIESSIRSYRVKDRSL